MTTTSNHRPSAPNPSGRPPVVAVLTEARHLSQAQPLGAVGALRALGSEVRVLVPGEVAHDLVAPEWPRDVDVVLARGRSSPVLGMLRLAQLSGVPVVQSAAAVQRVVDKVGATRTLAAHGVPVPRTWLGTPRALADRPDLVFPLVLKPVDGDDARGIRVVRSRVDLVGRGRPDAVALAQPFHRGDGHDLTVYVVGRHVWAVRRPSPIAVDGSPRACGPGHRVPVTPVLTGIARRCSSAFGLPLLGIDVVGGPERALVVDVDDFPDYGGLREDADRAVARLVVSVAAAHRPVTRTLS